MVVFNGQLSTRSAFDCVVPSRSVLGLILFFLYMADVTTIAEHYRLGAHSYADDTQLYAYCKRALNHKWLARIALCIEEIEKWMTSTRLKLNSDETHQAATSQGTM